MSDEKKEASRDPEWKRIFDNIYGQPKSTQPPYKPTRVEHKKLSNHAKSILKMSTYIDHYHYRNIPYDRFDNLYDDDVPCGKCCYDGCNKDARIKISNNEKMTKRCYCYDHRNECGDLVGKYKNINNVSKLETLLEESENNLRIIENMILEAFNNEDDSTKHKRARSLLKELSVLYNKYNSHFIDVSTELKNRTIYHTNCHANIFQNGRCGVDRNHQIFVDWLSAVKNKLGPIVDIINDAGNLIINKLLELRQLRQKDGDGMNRILRSKRHKFSRRRRKS